MNFDLSNWTFGDKFEQVRSSYAKALIDNFSIDFLASAPIGYLTLLYYSNLSHQELIGVNDFYKQRIVNKNVSVEFREFWKKRISIVSEKLNPFHGDLKRFDLESIISEVEESGEFGIDLKKHLRFCFVKAPNFRGASHPHTLFCLYLNYDECEKRSDVIKSIVHEIAHQELFILNLEDRLVREESDGTLKYAPFQRKERPPIARLHSAHVMYRLIKHVEDFSYDLENEKELLKDTLDTFDHLQLTAAGMSLVENYRRVLES
ncbi:HEXXH motif-containing putative peptide modification protein [Halobacteriovorax sp. JY17]|uniref:aKG-HExxH-type peptide beta-hydroxylase n=1 Tax=Halobacteriovorax sp. JY17 TaxID=2014617 RepID=UPI000C3656BA|nr:HEXXH motif-containing putative peptide modification protein [Halobacteriovorax sp. JY17]PIK14062.1 MAG: hypothetical protein CES88_13850 [Halobacteriovorax sp. JY17]